MFSIGSFFYIPVGISGDAGSCLSPSDQVIDPLHERALGMGRSWPECAPTALNPPQLAKLWRATVHSALLDVCHDILHAQVHLRALVVRRQLHAAD